jgi:hypothetical protein
MRNPARHWSESFARRPGYRCQPSLYLPLEIEEGTVAETFECRVSGPVAPNDPDQIILAVEWVPRDDALAHSTLSRGTTLNP